MQKRYIFALCFGAFFLFFLTRPVMAGSLTLSANLAASLHVEILDNDVILNLNPETNAFSSGVFSSSVSTNSPYGFRSIMSASSTALTRSEPIYDGSTPVIPTLDSISGGYTENSFPANHWGYSKSGNYLPFTGSFELDSTDGPTNGEDSTVNFAAKVNYEQPSGTYCLTLNLSVVANVLPVNMYMQDVTKSMVNGLDVGSVATLMDSRNEQSYDVTTIEIDGIKTLVMNKNLRLAAGTTLTSSSSNVSSNFTLSSEAWTSSSQNYYCKQMMAVVDDEYHYNWYAATANPYSCSSPTSTSNATVANDANSLGDICPKGWRLPSVSEAMTMARDRSAMHLFTGAGYYISGAHGGVNENWWTNDRSDNGEAYNLYSNGEVNIVYPNGKQTAYSVRCIFDNTYGLMQDITDSDINSLAVGDTILLGDSRSSEHYSVSVIKINNKKILWMNNNLRLAAGKTLTSSDSNVMSNFTLTTSSWTSSSQNYYCRQMMAKDRYSGEYYYNWYAATANPYSCSSPTTEQNATEANDARTLGDICPKGWRLLGANELGFMAVSLLSGTPRSSLSTTGIYYSGAVERVGEYGYTWFSTRDSDAFVNRLRWNDEEIDDVELEYRAGKNQGLSVRCIKVLGG